jgi:hypothetical protein
MLKYLIILFLLYILYKNKTRIQGIIGWTAPSSKKEKKLSPPKRIDGITQPHLKSMILSKSTLLY